MRSPLVWSFVLLTVCALAQDRQYQFGRLDMSAGLSHHTVNDIFRDKLGFVWFATSAGLNRYDGYSIRTFKNIPGDTTSIFTDNISKIFEGPDNTLWIFTHSGNTVYDPTREVFHRNMNRILKSYGIDDGVITNIFKDRAGRFWMIHYNQGLFVYDPASKRTTRLKSEHGGGSGLASNQLSAVDEDSVGNVWLIHQNGVFEKIDGQNFKVTERYNLLSKYVRIPLCEYDIMVDRDGDLWIYNDRNYGCFYFNNVSKRVTNFTTASKTRLSSDKVNEIIQDDEGLMWIGTENGGLSIINKKDLSVRYLKNEKGDSKSLAENTAQVMYRDDEGIIWIGSYKNGVSYYHPNIFRFEIYSIEPRVGDTLPYNEVNAFAEDRSGNIWIGTNGGGLIYFDRKNKTFKPFLHNPQNPNSLSNNVVVSLLMDHAGILWIGTYFGGLNSFDGKYFRRYKNEPSDTRSLGDDNIWEIFEDSSHNIWLGTLTGGVDVLDRSNGKFFHYRPNQLNSIHTTYVPALGQDASGNMWIGTGFGLEILDANSGRFTHYLHNPTDPASLSNNSILTIYRDSRDWMWVGSHGGLSRFDPSTNKFISFRESDGLAHNSVLTITEDKNHDLWMSTPKGLSKLVIRKQENDEYGFFFENYGTSDGLIKGAFHENAVLRCSSGELLFGGSNGFNIFNPEDIKPDTTTVQVVFTDFQVLNQSVKIGEEIGGEIILQKSISYTDKVVLSPDNNFFSIEFTALNFYHPEKSQYKYQLEGLNKEWLTTTSAQRKITFTTLEPGDYVFRVKGTNSDGLWGSKEATLHITILPPFWKTKLAFVLYGIIIIGSLLIGRRFVVARERLKFDLKNERLAAQRLHELDVMKIKFFTNVSHELRTPLTLILTPLEKLLRMKNSADERKYLELIHRNARRLLNMVNQLLDFRKMEVQEVKLDPSEGDIVQFVRDLVTSFSDLSEKKNIQLEFETSIQKLETSFDHDKVEKVMFNLLSNAFKFTPENGKVKVNLYVEDGATKTLVLNVTDTGIGIPAEKHQKIFERFFQNDLPGSLVNQGSGIGLSIAQEFIKIHGGSIEVESEPGKGSTFIVKLPVKVVEPLAKDEHPLESEEFAEVFIDEEEKNTSEKKPVLLLVEDNEDFRFYLKDNLKSRYEILETSNGKAGLDKAFSVIPDLIVSDVMMPELDGIEFCKKIKQDARTSHIPIILLTAQSSPQQKIEGFDAGANDYITKPFSFEILESRIKNLLNLRKLGHKQFHKHFDIKVSEVEVSATDEKLVNDAVKLVEDNLTNTNFSVEEMSRMLAMSRVQLYKKLYSLTGKTPIEFIRFVRIQRAAQLLRKSNYTVSEVAYQVGFNNPKYFAKHFKEEFNILPSAYASQARERKDDASE